MSDDLSVSIRRVNPPELGTPPGYSHVVEVRAGHIIFIAGQTALDQSGKISKEDGQLKHGRSISLPRSSEPVFRDGHATCRSGCNIARSVTTLWLGFHDRDRGRSSGLTHQGAP
jgi:hypothetical protein